jgi:hypothetical protein
LGLKVRIKSLSPPGERGGVNIYDVLGLWGLFATILEMKIGDGGAVNFSEFSGLAIFSSKLLISLSVVPIAIHFVNS